MALAMGSVWALRGSEPVHRPSAAHEPRPMTAQPPGRLGQVGRAIAVALAAPRNLYQGCGLPGTLTRSV